MRGAFPVAATALTLASGCGSPAPDFPTAAARTHVVHLAAAVGSRPAGTDANRRARDYLIETLTRAGFAVSVQTADATSSRYGVSGRVHNVIAVSDGPRRDAIALVAHYDSVAEGPGAADDAFGTAVVVEAARVLARRAGRQWSLMVLLTDAEEEGLLGASAVVLDAQVRERVKVAINVEAMGGDRPVLMFESGPGNGWLTRVWARSARQPRGASFNLEIYRRMPNDTDLSVLRQAGIPGLNIAATGDTYAYHTSADSPARVTDGALSDAGAMVMSVVDALQREDITRRTTEDVTYFDILGLTAVAWSPATDLALLAAALALGVVALVRAAGGVVRAGGVRSLVLAVVWAAVGAVVVAAAMIGSLALQRAVREVYHPWYAEPGRFVVMMSLAGAASGWLVGRLAVHLPAALRLPRDPAAVLVPTFIVWLLLAGYIATAAPRAGYLWVLPLLALAAPVAIRGTSKVPAVAGSALALAVAAVLWLPLTESLVRFLVPLLGGLPIVTPVWALPAMLLTAAAIVVPPLIALAVATGVPRLRFATRALLVSAGLALAWAYQATPYTPERPLRLTLASVSGEAGRAETITVISGNEPAPDPGDRAPLLTPVSSVPDAYARYTGGAPFVSMAPPGPPRRSAEVTCVADADSVTVTVVPSMEGARARLELPPGLVPVSATPPGGVRGGRWTAAAVGIAHEGMEFRVRVDPARTAEVCDGRVAVGLPRPAAPDGWLARPGVAWRFRVVDILPLR